MRDLFSARHTPYNDVTLIGGEGAMAIAKSVQEILDSLEPGAARLQKTPHRVAKACEELFRGYSQSPAQLAGDALYEAPTSEMVVLCDIPFASTCEHHMLPIVGHAHVGYLPDRTILGASKLARFVDCFAHRLQLQERLTVEIAQALHQVVAPQGVAVAIRAEHFCMTQRGVQKSGAQLVTRHFSGVFCSDRDLREEFLRTCHL
ncbi:MAG: GTP cyclohydrolase I FolE [Holosporales bacterium]|jgi:GTP cyclohydrolase I|nr:GTP cyclohydrolase I FolE [Holosporales bacterium]